tara:strand:+ start:2685 stop:3062 length:378 start_codon:yes stop_codon:yes gene_type:complete
MSFPVTLHGASFSFRGFDALISGVSVETPKAEIINTTSVYDNVGVRQDLPTGEQAQPGTITVDYIAKSTSADPQNLVHAQSQLNIVGSNYSITRNVILESASVDARTGNSIRGSLKFRMTDFYFQ